MCPIDGWATVPAAIVSEARLKPGSTALSAFRVGAFLEDDGAMAIYGGSRIDNGRPVRIATIILPPSASLPEIARMQRSANKLEEVKHPNIAQVLASGTTDRGDLAIVSEHIEGPTLAELLRGGELGPDRAASLGIGLFQALEAAHAAGIAHHDLSPERIRMAPGRVVVCDFGLADILRTPKSGMPWGNGEGEVPLLSRGLPYRAPEQARDRAVTKQADIYAVGAILYEAMTGRPLFVEKSSADYLIAHMMKAPTAPALRNDVVFDGLAELVMKCLEKKPWHRPESATVARETLEDLRNRAVEAMAQQAGRPAPQSRRAAKPLVVEVVEAPPTPPPGSVPSLEASLDESALRAEERAKAAMAIAETASAIAESAGSLVESANKVVEAAKAKESAMALGSGELVLARAAVLAPGNAAANAPSGLMSIADIAQLTRTGSENKVETTAPALPPLGVLPLTTRGTGRPAAIATEDGSRPNQSVQKPRRSRWGTALAAGVVVGLGAVGLGYALSGGPRQQGQGKDPIARVERESTVAARTAVSGAGTAPTRTEVTKTEVKPTEVKPTEVETEVAKTQARLAEVKRIEVKTEVAKTEVKPAEVKPTEVKTEVAKAEVKPTEVKTEVAKAEVKPTEVTEVAKTEVKPTEVKIEVAKTEVKPTTPVLQIGAADAARRARSAAREIEQARVRAVGLAKDEAARIEAAKVEAAKVEAAKVEAAKVEAAKIEAAKVEAAKIEAAKVEKVEVAKVEKVEVAKVEKVEVAKVEKVEVAKVEKVEVGETDKALREAEARRIASEEAEAKRAARTAELARKAEEAAKKAEEKKQKQLAAAEEKKQRQIAAEQAKQAKQGTSSPEQAKSGEEQIVRRALLSSVPPGAAVLIDGKSVGRTPMTLTWAPDKTANVWVTLAGFEPANFQVGEAQNGKMMRLELIPVGGTANNE